MQLWFPVFFLLLFGVTSYVDMPAYTGFRDVIHYRIFNPCYGGTVHSGFEPMTDMLLSRSSWRLYHGTGSPLFPLWTNNGYRGIPWQWISFLLVYDKPYFDEHWIKNSKKRIFYLSGKVQFDLKVEFVSMDIFVTQKSINLFFVQINALALVPYVNECHVTLIVLPNGHIETKSFPLHIISFLSNRISNEQSNRAKITFQNIELFLRSSVTPLYRNMDSLNVGKCNLLADWNLTLKKEALQPKQLQ